jgi:hypothetical protein
LGKRRLLCRLSSTIHRQAGKQAETKFKDQITHSTPISVKQIVAFRKTALRHGIWFRTLNRVERGILDLTIKYVARIKSSQLATIVTAIIEKLHVASQTIVDMLTRSVGFMLAKKMSSLAVSWGNCLAHDWANDAGFARYLAVSTMNKR